MHNLGRYSITVNLYNLYFTCPSFYSSLSSTSEGSSHRQEMNATDVSYHGPGRISFTPLLAPNAIFTSVFTILLLIHLFLAISFWCFYGYAIGMLGGLLLELLGYVAKVQLAHDRSNKNGYIMYGWLYKNSCHLWHLQS